jgi:hypothetical protein
MYHYYPRRYPTPGTGNYAFDAQMTLPLYQVQGAGIVQKNAYRVRQFGMVMNQATVTQTDFAQGGWVAGQFIGQPLSPPPSS